MNFEELLAKANMGDYVAVAALVLSLILLITQFRQNRRQNQLQNRMKEIEEARREEEVNERLAADVTARVDKEIESDGDRSRKTYYFILHNFGPALAREVKANIECADGGNMVGFLSTPLAVTVLDRNQDYRFMMIISMGDCLVYSVELTWFDDQGRKFKTLQLTI